MEHDSPRFMRVRDAARELGLSVGRTYTLAREGRIPAIRQGKAVRIPRRSFEAWMQAREAEALAAVRDAHTGTVTG